MRDLFLFILILAIIIGGLLYGAMHFAESLHQMIENEARKMQYNEGF